VSVPQVDSESTEEGAAPVPAPGMCFVRNPNKAFQSSLTRQIFPKITQEKSTRALRSFGCM
jgi:hypothetical protein